MVDFFVYRQHLILVFDLLSVNLFEVLRQNQFRGLSCALIRNLTKQLLHSLVALKKAHILHCDLKPENVLLCTNRNTKIKLIDFGSACFQSHMAYTYIQSRFYRSPEVLFGVLYTGAIDMWSLGCICAELYLGLPIFPGNSEYDQVARIVEVLGLPPDHMLNQGKQTSRFLIRTERPSTPNGAAEMTGVANYSDSSSPRSNQPPVRPASAPEWLHKASKAKEKTQKAAPTPERSPSLSSTAPTEDVQTESKAASYRLMTVEEYEASSMKKERKNKRYHKFKTLEEMVDSIPLKNKSTDEKEQRKLLLHFLEGVLALDPAVRWTPAQSLTHPFITGEGNLVDWACPHDPGEPPMEERNDPPPPRSALGLLLSPQDERNPEAYRPPVHLLPESYFRCRGFRFPNGSATSPPMQSTLRDTSTAMPESRNSINVLGHQQYGADSPASVTSGRSEQNSNFKRAKQHGLRSHSGEGYYQWSPFPNYRYSPNSQASSSRMNSMGSPMTFEFAPRSRGSSPWHLASPASSYQGDIGRVQRYSISDSPFSSGSESVSLMPSDEDEMMEMQMVENAWGPPGNKFDLFQNDSWAEYICRHGSIGRPRLPENRDGDAFRKATGMSQSGPVVPKKAPPGLVIPINENKKGTSPDWQKMENRRSSTGSPKSPNVKNKGGKPTRY
eukprot:GEMP01004108.1.p1 GENE.GEMP01004108.1~~GEMP01004108.1.p1  ORF type:complete len:670 (+),score=93.71 GEMP01004108.1:562-2571(+)